MKTSTGSSNQQGRWPAKATLGAVAAAAFILGSCGGSPGGGSGSAGSGITRQAGLPTGPDSIEVSAGPRRTDPEGVAPPAPAVHRLTWRDSRGAPRTMTLFAYLYEYRFSFVGGQSNPAAVTERTANDDAWGHEGFGYVVSHTTASGNSPLGKAFAPTNVHTTVLAGGHHARHRVELLYDRGREPGGQGIAFPVVIEWLTATGHDHPVWSVTYKMNEVRNPNAVDLDSYRMDVRGPYGSLNFDGAANRSQGDAIGGVAWGDAGLRFQTTTAPLTLQSAWAYDAPNSVAFTRAWTQSVNAEMGIVQTLAGDRTMGNGDRVVGRERGSRSTANYTGKGQCADFDDARVYAMPCVNAWPYQLMNYDWGPTTGKSPADSSGTKLMAWGSPYGWLGASSFSLFDFSGQADGRGERAYATFIVLGPQCRFDGIGQCSAAGSEVLGVVSQVEALAAASVLAVSPGRLATQAPVGPGAATQKAIAFGYVDQQAAFHLHAQNDQVQFIFQAGAGRPVVRPLFVVRDYRSRSLPRVLVDGAAVSVNDGTAASGAFVSIDTERDELWVTLNRTVSGAPTITIGP